MSEHWPQGYGSDIYSGKILQTFLIRHYPLGPTRRFGITPELSNNFLFFRHRHYTYAFSRCFESDLQCIQAIHFFYQYVCSLGIEPMSFCTANAMLYHWATGTQKYCQRASLKICFASDFLLFFMSLFIRSSLTYFSEEHVFQCTMLFVFPRVLRALD